MSTPAPAALRPLDPLDPLDLDLELSPEERETRDGVRAHEGTSEVHTLVVGHALTGEKALA